MPKLRINPLSVTYHLLKNDVHKLEYDPATQLHVNIVMARFWVANFFFVLAVFIFANQVWKVSSILYLALVSIYDSWVGHYSGIPAGYAALKSQEIQQAQTTQISTNNLALEAPNAQSTDSEQINDPRPSSVAESDVFSA